MEKIRPFLVLLVATTAGLTVSPPAAGQTDDTGFVSTHILVRLDPVETGKRFGSARGVSRAAVAAQLGLADPGAVREPTYNLLRRQQEGRKATGAGIDVDRFLLVDVPPGWSAEAFAGEMGRRPGVAHAEVDGIGTGGATLPNDPVFYREWWHVNTLYTNGSIPADIRSSNAWTITTGSTNVTVAVLDTGLNTGLVEFIGRTVPGYDFVNNDDDPADDHNHGTGVSGVLGANAGNGSLFAGMDWHCRIMPVKVLNASNAGSYSDFADGVDWAVAKGADVINFSIGGTSHSTILSNAIMNAITNHVIFVTITHNQSSASVRFPGRMAPCITVGATDSNDHHSSFSNRGPEIDLVAPGRGIYTTSRTGGQLQNWYGTSFSCPMVAGVAAMIRGLRPDIDQYEMEAILAASADDEVGHPAEDLPGFDNYHGWGRLNAYSALVMATAETRINSPATGAPTLAWPSPPNASNRQPYRVEYAMKPGGSWTNAGGTLIYGATQTQWNAGSSPVDAAMYRVVTGP